MTQAHARTCVGIALVLALAPCAALAQEAAAPVQPVDPSDAEYRRLVAQAIVEYDAASFDEALALFEQAYALRPSARVLRGMGKVYFEQRQYVRAYDAFDAALTTTVDPLTPTMREEVASLRARSAAYVGTLTLVVEPASASVLVDGEPVVPNEPVRLDVGSHLVEVSAASFLPTRRSVEISGATDTEITVTLVADDPDVLVVERERGAAIATATTGLALVAVTVGSGIWLASRSDARDACRAAERMGVTCTTRDTIERERRAALGTTAGSATLAIGAGILFVVLVTGERDESSSITAASCAPHDRGALCTLGGRF